MCVEARERESVCVSERGRERERERDIATTSDFFKKKIKLNVTDCRK